MGKSLRDGTLWRSTLKICAPAFLVHPFLTAYKSGYIHHAVDCTQFLPKTVLDIYFTKLTYYYDESRLGLKVNTFLLERNI